MARRKQSLPSRANGIIAKKANSIELPADRKETKGVSTSNLDNKTTDLETCRQGKHLVTSTHTYGGGIYSPLSALDSYIDVAEISIENATFYMSMSPAELEATEHKVVKNLNVRLQLLSLGRDCMVGQYTLSADDVRVEILEHFGDPLNWNRGGDEQFNTIVSGYLDSPDASISALVYLFKAGYLSITPCLQVIADSKPSCRLQIGITQKAFDSSDGLLDNAKNVWSRSLLKVMEWLRPDLHSNEAMYDVSACQSITAVHECLQPSKHLEQEQEGESQAFCEDEPFDPSILYEAIRPDHGCVSRIPCEGFCDIQGGILADEMGLGKTVELLACILTNSYRSFVSAQPPGNDEAEKAAKNLHGKLMQQRRERIECPCGAIDDYDYSGLWVQCDCCDAWQHASCVGFGLENQDGLYLGQERRLSRQDSNSQRTREKKRGRSAEETIPSEERKKKRRSIAEGTVRSEEEQWTVKEGYICGTCARLIGSVEIEGICGATLIVCPTPILGQWQEEISRHVKEGALKVIVYEGVQKGYYTCGSQVDEGINSSNIGKIVGAHELATADIVLTTYDILRMDLLHDVERNDEPQRSMRFQKRYPVVPTPLTRLHWWRVCLDEAQMVESSCARATEMALRLSAEIRWCITGTPIQRGLDDLYGLLNFLGVQPFNDLFWWTKVIKEPYERKCPGAIYFAHAFFRKFMWRSSKAHVYHELGLPPQEEVLTWLKFSPIEAHFYRRQHDRCASKAMEIVSESSRSSENQKSSVLHPFAEKIHDRELTHAEAAKVLNPLLSLRQACCHPQVGSSGLRSLQKSPMTMDEVLKVLIEKVKTEGEEAQRSLLGALNGLAALALLNQDIPVAIAIYREALSLTEENAEDLRVDPLQKLHILHNLNESLKMLKKGHDDKKNAAVFNSGESSFESSVPRTLRDDLLEQQCQDIRAKYMSPFYSKLSAAKQDYKTIHDQLDSYLKELGDTNGTTWWLDALTTLRDSSRQGNELVQKIKESLLAKDILALSRTGHENASSLALRFSDINGLKYILNRELDAIYHHRQNLVDRISEIDKMMDNPNALDVEQAVHCSICDDRQKGPSCAHCESDKLFQMYENRLFLLKSSAANIGEVVSLEDAFMAQQRIIMQKRVSTLKTAAGSCGYQEESLGRDRQNNQSLDMLNIQVSRSPSETEGILRIIKAYMKQRLGQDGLNASKKHLEAFEAMRKEFAQARMLAVSQRMVLFALDELNMAITRLRLRYPGEEISNATEELFKLHPEEIPQRNTQLTGDKFIALENLFRAKGQLRYLKGLAIARERGREIKQADNCSPLQIGIGELSMQERPSNGLDKKAIGLGSSDEETCPVCHELLAMQMMVLPCGHMLCCKCMMTIAEQAPESKSGPELKRITCPSCRYRTHLGNIAFIDNESDANSYSNTLNKLHNIEEDAESSIFVKGSYGTKMEAVAKRILRVKMADPNAKFLLFSTWNDVLDVVEHTLSANNIRFVRAKGRRNLDAAIREFKGKDLKDPNQKDQISNKPVQVLLLLLQQGANGLNLVEAQHVILVEPLLNPGAEAQAVNRVHRIGQHHATYVHKFLIRDTVEESIYKLGQLKVNSRSQASMARKRNNQEIFSLTVNDLNMLFNTETYDCNQPLQADVSRTDLPGSSLRNLPPAAAAAAAAEARLKQAFEDRHQC